MSALMRCVELVNGGPVTMKAFKLAVRDVLPSQEVQAPSDWLSGPFPFPFPLVQAPPVGLPCASQGVGVPLTMMPAKSL
jgi:hypothetical protein